MIFCEGLTTEPDYIKGLKGLPEVRARTAITIEIDTRVGAPITLVERARDRPVSREVDERWCVFDVEAPIPHTRLLEAVELAGRHGIRLAISNPCFELWLLLHDGDYTGYLTTDDAKALSKSRDDRTSNHIDASKYLPHRREATRRARRLDDRHVADGTVFPKDNPSSSVWSLLKAIEGDGEDSVGT